MREQIYTAENKANHIIQLQDKLFHSPLKCIVHQYDQNDREIGIFDIEALYRCPNYRDYYYRIEPFLNTPRWKAIDSYFGLRVSNTGSNRFDIGIYHNQLINEFISYCTNPKQLVWILNSNLHFHYTALRSLSLCKYETFNAEFSSFLRNQSLLSEIHNLKSLNGSPGLYLLVLDDYASCYVGQSTNIKRRIQQHWSKFNCGTTGIDMFKALDTTRIFAFCIDTFASQRLMDQLEYGLIHSIDRRFLLNCLGGGTSLEILHSDSPLHDPKSSQRYYY